MIKSVPRLRDNIIALGLLQGANYIVPLISTPYLTRVLGASAYGRVAFVQVLMAYFVIVVEFGFSWNATREISANRFDKEYVSTVFINTWFAQLVLLVIAAILATCVVCVISKLREDAFLYAAGFVIVIGTAFFPVWLLQGLERLREVAFIQISCRVIGLILLFIFVHGPQNIVVVLIVQGMAVLLGGVFCLLWIRNKEIIYWKKPSLREILKILKVGYKYFNSKVSISLYTMAVPLVLGWVAGPVSLAYFSLADKLRGAIQAMWWPITQSLFPRMSHLFQKDPDEAVKLIRRSFLFLLVFSGLSSLLLFLFSDKIVVLFAGKEYYGSSNVLKVMAFIPMFIALGNVFGVQVLLANGRVRIINVTTSAGAICSLLSVYPLVMIYKEIGAAMVLFSVEMFVSVVYALVVIKGYGQLMYRKDICCG